MTLPLPGMPGPESDAALELVRSKILSLDPHGDHFASIIRETYDQLLDGRRMGRWDYQQLHKTEKTHMGTLVEINLYKGFSFKEGEVTDYEIEGVQVDCKYSKRVGGWEIGPEIAGHICLVVTANDDKSTWQAGLVRASEEHLRTTRNRDQKRRLSPQGEANIRWLWGIKKKLSPNQLLHMDAKKRHRIMTAQGKVRGKNGQARINQLFLEVQGIIVRRTTLETVGHGLDDPLKRARSNGGARDALRERGILVLGHQDNDPQVASSLGLPVPRKGEFISVRVTPAPEAPDGRPVAEIEGKRWTTAAVSDQECEAPRIPRKKAVEAS